MRITRGCRSSWPRRTPGRTNSALRSMSPPGSSTAFANCKFFLPRAATLTSVMCNSIHLKKAVPTEQEVRNLIEDGDALGFDMIEISGGEPYYLSAHVPKRLLPRKLWRELSVDTPGLEVAFLLYCRVGAATV